MNGNLMTFKETIGIHPLSIDALLNIKESMPDEATKIRLISTHFKQIMHILGLDLDDDSLKGTPDRVAKMYVKEIFNGLDAANKPDITLFENKYIRVQKQAGLSSCKMPPRTVMYRFQTKMLQSMGSGRET